MNDKLASSGVSAGEKYTRMLFLLHKELKYVLHTAHFRI